MSKQNQNQAIGKPSVIVLDMDGLMFNTEDIYDATGHEVLRQKGFEFEPGLKKRMMGRTARAAFQEMRDWFSLDDSIDQLQAESNRIWLELLPQRIEKLPGLDWLLNTADELAIPLAVATSSPRDLATVALGHFSLVDRFRVILTGDDVSRGKPDPEIYLAVANHFRVHPETMIVFEDSPIGSMAAVKSGARTIAIPGHHNSGEDYSHVWQVVERLDSDEVRNLAGMWHV